MTVYRYVYSIEKYGADHCEGVVVSHGDLALDDCFNHLRRWIINWLGATHPLNFLDFHMISVKELSKAPQCGYINVSITGKVFFK